MECQRLDSIVSAERQVTAEVRKSAAAVHEMTTKDSEDRLKRTVVLSVIRQLRSTVGSRRSQRLMRALWWWQKNMKERQGQEELKGLTYLKEMEYADMMQLLANDKAAAVWHELMRKTAWNSAAGAVIRWRDKCVEQRHQNIVDEVQESLIAEWSQELRHNRCKDGLLVHQSVMLRWRLQNQKKK